MDLDILVQNIKSQCDKRGYKPTVACREAGVGQSFINNMEKQRSVPSVEKVQMLAHYLGVTVSELIGETQPQARASDQSGELVLHDSAIVVHPTDFKRLTVSEVEMVMAYRRARQEIKNIVDGALAPYAKKENTASIG